MEKLKDIRGRRKEAFIDLRKEAFIDLIFNIKITVLKDYWPVNEVGAQVPENDRLGDMGGSDTEG